jgi:hypothetical protein
LPHAHNLQIGIKYLIKALGYVLFGVITAFIRNSECRRVCHYKLSQQFESRYAELGVFAALAWFAAIEIPIKSRFTTSVFHGSCFF